MAEQQATDQTNPQADQQTCANCGLVKAEWSANHGEGFTMAGKTYCCDGCATGTGCTCQ